MVRGGFDPDTVCLTERLAVKTDSRILLAVIDGLGDIPIPELGGLTPLETAKRPGLDRLASEGALGLHIPIAPGITPGSGPAHLALFGYDPVEYGIGRGVLSALGVGFPLKPGDLAARMNFCTVNDEGTVVDRRAGRISTELCTELVGQLSRITIPGVEITVLPEKEHRACVVFRGDGLDDDLNDTDPGHDGMRPHAVKGDSRSAEVVREFVRRSGEILTGLHPANFLLLRGFAVHTGLPSMSDRFSLTPSAVALYPMYRGVARLVGMDVAEVPSGDLEGQVRAAARAAAGGADFVFLHHKPADSMGEDGNAPGKIRAIEAFDGAVPGLLEAGFDVICVTGDHSTPCGMKLHSWHPVPVLIHGGPQRSGWSSRFTEREARNGSLGTFRAVDLLPQLLASAGKLEKYGA